MLDSETAKKWKQAYGLHVGVEYPKGSQRKGVGKDGKAWSRTVKGGDYGFFANTHIDPNGGTTDGEGVDVYLHGDPDANGTVYVVNQHKADGSFDEAKCMVGWGSEDEARDAYTSNYPEGWTGLGSVATLNVPGFKDWLATADKSVPLTQDAADKHMKNAIANPQTEVTDADSVGEASPADVAKRIVGACVQAGGAAGDVTRIAHHPKKGYAVSVGDWINTPAFDAVKATCPEGTEIDSEWNCHAGDAEWSDVTPSASSVSASDVAGSVPATDGSTRQLAATAGSTDALSHEPILDAVLLDEGYYKVVDESGAVLDAAKMGKPGENGPLRVSLLASLAGKANANGRYFTPEYMRLAAPAADRQSKATPTYGEEPHPPFDPNRGQYVTDSTKEVWQGLGWHADSKGNLWSTVLVDEATPKGLRVGQKVRRGEKLGVSVRWTPIGNAYKDATDASGRKLQYYDADAFHHGFLPLVLDHVGNPAFPEAGHAMFDCEGSCELPLLDAAHGPTGEVMTDVHALDSQDAQAITLLPHPLDSTPMCGCGKHPAVDATAKQQPCGCRDAPPGETQRTGPPGDGPIKTHASPGDTTDAALAAGTPPTPLRTLPPMTKEDAAKLTPAQRKAELKKFRAALKGQTDAAEKDATQDGINALLDADEDAPVIPAAATTPTPTEDSKVNEDQAKAQAALDAQAKQIADSLAEMKKMTDTMNEAKAALDAQATENAAVAAKAELSAFCDSIKTNTAEGYDLERFVEPVRGLMAKAALKAGTLDAAKEVLADQIEQADAYKAQTDAANLGYKGQHEGKTANDDRGTAPKLEGDVTVTADEGDKIVAGFKKQMHDSWDRFGYEKEATIPDKGLRKANEGFVKDVRERAREKARAAGHDYDKAVVDSTRWILATPEQRKKIDTRAATQTMVDAGLFDKATVQATQDATTSTANMLNQATLADFHLERAYFDNTALQYVGGMSDGTFEKQGGSVSPVGTVLRIPTIYRDNSAIDYPNDFGSLVVGESQAIPTMNPDIAYAEYPVFPRRQSLKLTKDIESQLAHGPLHMNALAVAQYQFLQAFSLSTDRYLYTELDATTSEQSSVYISAAAETPNTPDIVNGNVQDGITYGATVACIVQPLCGGYVTGAQHVADAAVKASASPAYRAPLLRPRTSTIINGDGSRTLTLLNNVVVTLGGTALVRGYMDDNGDIQSYANTTAAYAVDWVRGKFLFTAASTVTATNKPVLVSYAYSTNADYFQVKFGTAGYPGAIQPSDYFKGLVLAFDTAETNLASYPNYMPPNTVLSTYGGSLNLRNASIFYAFLSPNGTNLEGEGISRDFYAKRGNLGFYHTNTPAAFGNDTHLVFSKGWTKYCIDTPLALNGPYPAYDTVTGLITDDSFHKASEFSVIATPLPKNQAQTILNKTSRRLVTY